jgi:hypothetical protein
MARQRSMLWIQVRMVSTMKRQLPHMNPLGTTYTMKRQETQKTFPQSKAHSHYKMG